ncbi:hypothetical protein E1B28_013285 [Marasmius oreades]|nr:uncharacterized protein E1B28_013285 [Marasmius oreades]KAG7087308.1 hypothetical protein E1B28_013285 [Marasmius oreades]
MPPSSLEVPCRQSARLKALPQKTFNDESDDEPQETRRRKRGVKRLKKEQDDSEPQLRGKCTKIVKPRRGRLSLLPTMPLDILYMIFSYLPPKSLLALTQMNHVFRKTLLSPGTTFIWTGVRRSCKAPDPFPGMPEVNWARLLFGSTHCQECGHKGVQTISFILQKRICCACVKNTGLTKNRFKHRYPGVDKSVLDLIIPTDGGQRNGHTSYYSTSEIDRVLARINTCRNPEEVEQYKKERKDYLERLKVHDRACKDWVYADYARQVEDVVNVRAARFGAVKYRLVAMGYTDKDIEGVRDHPHVSKDKLLTDHGWSMIKKEVTKAVMYYRVLRLLEEKTDATTSRCRLIAQAYADYKKSLQPEEWSLLPCIEAVWLLPSMAAVLALPDNVSVTESDLVGPAGSLPEETRAEIDKLKSVIIFEYRFCDASWSFQPYRPYGGIELTEFHRGVAGDRLWSDPATVQARCDFCSALLTSVLTLLRHLTGPCKILKARAGQSVFRFGFGISYSRASACLVWATGLDLTTATAHEMDDRGAFYHCLKCPTSPQPFVGTWRECVVHAFDRLPDQCSTHNDFNQSINDPIFKVADGQWSDSRSCWACNHCNAHIQELGTRQCVVAHLRDQ